MASSLLVKRNLQKSHCPELALFSLENKAYPKMHILVDNKNIVLVLVFLKNVNHKRNT